LLSEIRQPPAAAAAAAVSADHAVAVIQRFANQDIVSANEQVVLIGPFNPNDPSNRWTSPQLDAAVQAMWADAEVQAAAADMLQLYRSSKQALIHNDLHAGTSPMSNVWDGSAAVCSCVSTAVAIVGSLIAVCRQSAVGVGVCFHRSWCTCAWLLCVATYDRVLPTALCCPCSRQQAKVVWSLAAGSVVTNCFRCQPGSFAGNLLVALGTNTYIRISTACVALQGTCWLLQAVCT
jgi:hypothetical protein